MTTNGHRVVHGLNLDIWLPPFFLQVPHSCCNQIKEWNILDLPWWTPLVPKATGPNSFSPDTIWLGQIGKAVHHPIVSVDGGIILSSNAMRRVLPNIACPSHDLDVSTSVIVALETCLCPKSYLIVCWIGLSQIWLGMHRIDGCGVSNSTGRLVIHCTFRITVTNWIPKGSSE